MARMSLIDWQIKYFTYYLENKTKEYAKVESDLHEVGIKCEAWHLKDELKHTEVFKKKASLKQERSGLEKRSNNMEN